GAPVGKAGGGLAGELDGSPIRTAKSGEQGHQGGLAGAVAADEGVAFSRTNVERDVDEGTRLTERFENVVGLTHQGRNRARPWGRGGLDQSATCCCTTGRCC